MITTKDFASLTDDMQSIFNEVAKTKVADMKCKQIWNIYDTGRRTFDHLILHGLAGIQELAEGQDLPSVTSEEGDNITFTQRHFGALVAVTKSMRKFDLHNQITTTVKSVTQDAFDKIDQSMADALTYGLTLLSYPL